MPAVYKFLISENQTALGRRTRMKWKGGIQMGGEFFSPSRRHNCPRKMVHQAAMRISAANFEPTLI
jgi:hypothetical protein